jgi:hypothetical protein
MSDTIRMRFKLLGRIPATPENHMNTHELLLFKPGPLGNWSSLLLDWFGWLKTLDLGT